MGTGAHVVTGAERGHEQGWSPSEMPVGLSSWRQMCCTGVGRLEAAGNGSRGPDDWLH